MAGGLVAGSTIALKKSGKPAMKSTLAMSAAAKNNAQSNTISFGDKIKQKSHAYETGLITSLTVSHESRCCL